MDPPPLLGGSVPQGEEADTDCIKCHSRLVTGSGPDQPSADCQDRTKLLLEDNEQGRSQLHLAAMHGQLPTVKFLLSKGIIGPDVRDITGNTPLHLAAQMGHLDIVKYLVSWRCLLECRNMEGLSALELARREKCGAVEEYLASVLEGLPSLFVQSAIDKPRAPRALSNYHERLLTYSIPPRWSSTTHNPEQLARVGFYYSGQEDRVKCFSCSVEIWGWADKGNPLLEHHSQSPNCFFLQQEFSSELSSLSPDYQYSTLSARLRSFDYWPMQHLVTPQQLAHVGFFYTGRDATVQCFSCGEVYQDWKKGDVPLLIHQSISPSCPVVAALTKKSQSPSHSSSSSSSTSYSRLAKPDYSDENTRLKSFKRLSSQVPVSAQECARVGLYLLKSPDTMKCFCCQAVLKDWVPGEVPVEKHREANPSCSFLKKTFPCKLDVSSSSSDTFDPSSLPEPQFNEEDLERLSLLSVDKHPSPSTLHPSPSTSSTFLSPHPVAPFPPFSSSSSSSSSSGSHPLPSLSTASHPPSPLSTTSHPPSSHSTAYHPPSSHSTASHPPSSLSTASRPFSSHYTHHLSPSPMSDPLRPSDFKYPTSSHPPPSYSTSSRPPSSTLSQPPLSPHLSMSEWVLPHSRLHFPPSHHHQTTSQYDLSTASTNKLAGSLDEKVCVVCLDAPFQMLVIPCGHYCVCEDCSRQLHLCPICRTPVQKFQKVFEA